MPLKSLEPKKASLYVSCSSFGTFYHVSLFFYPCSKLIYFMVIFAIEWQNNFQICVSFELSCLDCSFTCPLLWSSSIVLQLIPSSCNFSQSGIPIILDHSVCYKETALGLESFLSYCFYICICVECMSSCMHPKLLFCLCIYLELQL